MKNLLNSVALVFAAFVMLTANYVLYSKPTLTLQTGHISSINSIEYSKDGKLILTACDDKTIKLWSAESGLLLRTLKGHNNAVNSAHFSISSDTIISASADKTIKLWRTSSGELLNTFNGHQFQVSDAFLHPYNRILLSAGLDKEIRVWDVSKNSESIQRLVCSKPISSLALSEDGKYYATGEDKTLKLWKIESDKKEAGKVIFQFKDVITHIEFSQNGKNIIARSADNTLKVFDIDAQKEIFSGTCISKSFTASKNYLAFRTEDFCISVFDFKSGKKIKTSAKFDNDLIDFSFSPDGNNLAYSDINSGAGIIYIPSIRIVKQLSGAVNPLQSLDVSNNTKQIVSSNTEGKCNLWTLSDKMKPEVIKSSLDNILSVSFNSGGNLLSMVGMSLNNNAIEIYDIAKDESFNLKTDENTLIQGSFSPDNNYFAGLSNENLSIYDLKTKTLFHTFKSSSNHIEQCLSPTNSIIAVSDYSGAISFYDYLKKALVFKIQIEKYNAQSLLFNKEGTKLFAGASNSKIFVIDVNQKKIINSINISPDGIEVTALALENDKILIAGSTDNSIRFVDISGTEPKFLYEIKDAHENTITGLSILIDERKLISSSTDGSFKIWDLESIKPLVTIFQTDAMNWAAVSEDGRFDGTQGAFVQLHWVENNNALPIESYFEKYYKPYFLGNLFKSVEIVPDPAPLTALRGLINPPVCNIIFPIDSDTLESENTKFTYELIPASNDIEEVFIYHNDKLVKREFFAERKSVKITKTINIPLVDGENIFKIIALDKDRVESLPSEIVVYSVKADAKSNIYILSIGVGDYNLKSLALPFAKHDAESVNDILSNLNISSEGKLKIYSIYDKDANVPNVNKAFAEIAKMAKPEDTFILYFAGHGITITNPSTDIAEYYLVMQNTNNDFLSDEFRKLNLSATNISNNIELIKALNQLIIIDACQSGDAISKINKQMFRAGEKTLSLVSRRSGLNILSSTTSDKPAYEILDLQHGLFTYTLLEGLKGPAAYGDSTISVLGMAMYLENELPKISKLKLGKRQNPVKTLNGPNFIVGRVKK